MLALPDEDDEDDDGDTAELRLLTNEVGGRASHVLLAIRIPLIR